MGASQTPDPIPAPEESADAAGAGAAEQNARLSGEGEEKQEGGEEEEEEEEEVADICGSTWEVSLLERQSPRGAADGLYVYHNMFHLVPGEVGRLRRLKTLKFFANEIEVLPPEVGDLVELERLQVKVSAPGIASLPFRKLKSLSELELCHVPPRLSALSVLSEISGLKCLTKLSVSHFCIRYLPPEICNLKKLEDLDLSFNKLKNLPDDIAELGSLKSLKVANNKLIELPSSISLLSSLEKLDLSNNRLTSLTSLRLTSMFTLQHLNLQYNKLPYGCHQIPSWIRCNLEGNVEGNSKDESCKSFAIVNTHDVTVRRMHWNHSCNGLHCASSSSHSEAPPSFRCHAIKRMKRLAWKRHSCLQQRVRQERLNHSRKWKDHNHNMNIKMVEEDDSSALLQHENLHSGLQTAAKGERILDDSGKLNAPYDNFAVDSDEFCLSKNAAVVLRHDSSVMNKVGPDKNLFDEQSSCTTSSSVILDKSDNIESDTEDNSSLLQSIRAIDAPDEHSSCEVSNIIPKTKRHSDKDLDNPKPCKFRKPVEDFSNLSSKYSIQSHCSIDDYVPDGFYDAGRDRPFKPLQDFEQLSLDSREVILLDRDKDEELDAIVFSAQLLMSSLQRSNVTGIEEHAADNLRRASILALFVSDCFGGSERSTLVLKMRRSILGLQKQQPFVCTCPIGNIFENNETFRRMYSNVADINTLCERSLRLIKESQNSNVVPIGTLRFGICRHRAVLMKYLCDRMDPPIPCELVRGYIDYMPHAWNVIHVRRGDSWLRMIVDACYPTDVREETDPEYFCRYIPLSRLHVPVRTGNPTVADAEWLFESSLLNHVTKSKATNSVFHYKIGTVDTAVKVRCLEADHTSDEEVRDFEYKLLGEVRILGALRNHRCIVDIYGHQLSCKWVPGTDEKNEHRLLQSMIIMEYVNGGSLKNYLIQLRNDGQKHVPVDDALCIARDVACALMEVHAKKIIHRDIKSENILVDFKTRAGGSPVIKLSDFDRSVPLDCFAHTCCIAHRGIHPPDVCVGTPRWMAPEVVKAMHQRNPYGLEVDIWSYGCLLLELLTLQVPYQGQCESEYYGLLQMQQRPRLTPELEALASSSDEGTIGSIPDEFSDADVKILKVLVDLFYQCTSGNSSDRPSAKDIYDTLSVISPRLEEADVTQQSD